MCQGYLIMKKILFLSIFLINFDVKAQMYVPNWQLYAETDVGIRYYVDVKSLFQQNDLKYVITMQDTSTQGTDFKSLSMYFEIDCKK
mgnify:FL=1